MEKRWIWILTVLGILLSAFLFPRVMLWITQRNAEKEVLTYGTGTLLNFDVLTLGEKQMLLSSPSVSVISSRTDIDSAAKARNKLIEELQKLKEFGAISSSAYDLFSSAFSTSKVQFCKAYDRNGQMSFHYYELNKSEEEVTALLDIETGKLLSLGGFPDYDIHFYEAERTDVKDPYGWETTLRSWAEYYGMTVQNISIFSFAVTKSDQVILASCRFRGEVNAEFGYAICLNKYTGICKCCAVELDNEELLDI